MLGELLAANVKGIEGIDAVSAREGPFLTRRFDGAAECRITPNIYKILNGLPP